MNKQITFELEELESDKKQNDMRRILYKDGYRQNASKVLIKRGDEVIGHIFTPGGSGDDQMNAIQICGFTEAFDLWGCGIFKGYKDIGLLFDDGIMGGKPHFELEKCCRCYMNPCQCENKIIPKKEHIDNPEKIDMIPMPFNVKDSSELKQIGRLEIKK